MIGEVGRRGRQGIERIKGEKGGEVSSRIVLETEQRAANGAAGGENRHNDAAALGVANPGLAGDT